MTSDETRAVELRLRAAVESAPSGLLMVDPEGRMVLVNREIERLFGYSREELLGKPVDLLVPEAARMGHAAFRRGFLDDPSVRAMGVGRDLHGRRKDGSEVPLEIGLTPVVTEEGLFVLSSIVDISARRRAEARFKAAVESSPAGMVMVDGDGRIVLVNREVERMFGWDRDELMGQPMEVLVPERFRGAHPGFRTSFFHAPDARPMGAGRDLFGLHKDGTEIPVEIGLNPIETEEGLLVLSSIVDITERRRVEEERAALEQQLRQAQKMDAVGTLAAGIAHDFNNILGAIMGYAELLEDSVERDDGRRDLEDLLRFVHRGRDLVQKIQAVGHRREGERRVLSLDNVMREVEGFLRSTSPPNIDIMVAVDRDTPRVLADPSAIHQVLMNLGTNAVQAMPGGGRLAFRAEPAYIADSRARTHPTLREGLHAILSVEDTGAGMDTETQGRAFEPFFTTKPPGKGSGLGLAIVHGIAREHGGALELDSAPGAGTRVRLILPAVESEEADDASVILAPLHGSGARVLYVDDEAGLAAVGKRRLERIGYVVATAANGEEALELLEAAPDDFDVVISDYLMPGINGVELATAIRGIRPDLPVVLLTGFIDELDPGVIESAGVTQLVQKPITFEELAAVVAITLGAG